MKTADLVVEMAKSAETLAPAESKLAAAVLAVLYVPFPDGGEGTWVVSPLLATGMMPAGGKDPLLSCLAQAAESILERRRQEEERLR